MVAKWKKEVDGGCSLGLNCRERSAVSLKKSLCVKPSSFDPNVNVMVFVLRVMTPLEVLAGSPDR